MVDKMVDKISLVAPPDKYFYTVDGKILTNIHQLSEYIKNCSNNRFQYHVGPTRNDFYNWLLHVFRFSDLADKIKNNYDQRDVADIIDKFIIESEQKTEIKEEVKIAEVAKETQKEEKKEENNDKKEEDKDTDKMDEQKRNEQKSSEKREETPAQQQTATESKDGKFREFSDEELEKFTKFGVKDTETPADEKLDYLKTELNELRNMIKDLRKTGKDMIIADLILRVVDPKMAFYEYTKSHDDYEKILQILNDVRREIDYASQQTETTIADEIIKSLELQRIMLKKDFTPQKRGVTGVLGKIFKPANQEANQEV